MLLMASSFPAQDRIGFEGQPSIDSACDIYQASETIDGSHPCGKRCGEQPFLSEFSEQLQCKNHSLTHLARLNLKLPIHHVVSVSR
jgi:hypothetical protein